MSGNHRQPACREVLGEQVDQQGLPGGVEGGAGLVEEPDRPGRDKQARQYQAALLPGREIVGIELGRPQEADAFQCGFRGEAAAPIDLAPEAQGLQDAEARPHRVLVPAMMDEGAGVWVSTANVHRAGERMQQSGQRQQQSGFARAIGAAQQQAGATGHVQMQILDKSDITATTGKILCLKVYRVLDLPLRHGPISYWTHGRTGKGLVD